jgi:hypothetical protein
MTSRTRTTRHHRFLAAGAAGAATLLIVSGAATATGDTEELPTAPTSEMTPLPDAPSAEEAARIAAERTPATAVGPWSAEEADTTDYDPTQPLSAVVLTVEGGTASSPQQVALFNHGVYIGTTVPESYPYQQVTRSAGDILRVDYRFLLPDDPNADPHGSSTSHYILYPQSVDRAGALPPGGGVPPEE